MRHYPHLWISARGLGLSGTSTHLTRQLSGTHYAPLRHPSAPGLSLTGIRLIILITHWGFPCCVRFPCVHAAATTPVQQMGVFVAHTCPIHISLPRFHCRVGLHIVLFEVCSAFTPRCGLHTRAVTKFVTAIRGLQTFRHLHACSDCFRRERIAGGPCTH